MLKTNPNPTQLQLQFPKARPAKTPIISPSLAPNRNQIIAEQIVKAYYNARENKRNTSSQLNFELNLEENLCQLIKEITDHTYQVQPSNCFIVTEPVKREVFAANFRDRIIHHYLYNAIAPMTEQILIEDCYSCRKGKGTLFGIRRLHNAMRSCSQNFTQDCYILKLDIQGYFMNINRDKLYHILMDMFDKYAARRAPCKRRWAERIDYPLVIELLQKVIYADPTEHCNYRSPKSMWSDLPRTKSLFGTPQGFGLPIGNLTSQLFSNIYLSGFDNFCKHNLHLKHYGRYVDDFYIVHQDKEYLKSLIKIIHDELRNTYDLELHPKKIYLQSIYKGVTFLGAKLKGASITPGKRTLTGLRKTVYQYNSSKFTTYKLLDEFTQKANSYIGATVNMQSYKLRKKMIEKIHPKHNHIIKYNPHKYHKISTIHLLKKRKEYPLDELFSDVIF